jgi:hypothetical protein
MKSITKLAGIFLILSIVLISCQKENSDTGGGVTDEAFASQASTEADAESGIVFNDVFDNVIGVNDFVGIAYVGVFSGRANTSGGGLSGRTDTIRCFTITTTHLSTTNPFPVTIVLDFGTGCVGRDGHLRSGKIITTYTNRLLIPGGKATTTFDNFYFDSIHVEGTHMIENIGTLTELKLKVVVEGARLTKPNGNYIEWSSRRTITRIEGNLTPLPFDDIFSIEGNSNGKVKRGNIIVAWNTEIVEPLIKKFLCRWIVKGRLRVVRLNLSNTSPWVAVLDFGNGNCDNKAFLTINGQTFEITLP